MVVAKEVSQQVDCDPTMGDKRNTVDAAALGDLVEERGEPLTGLPGGVTRGRNEIAIKRRPLPLNKELLEGLAFRSISPVHAFPEALVDHWSKPNPSPDERRRLSRPAQWTRPQTVQPLAREVLSRQLGLFTSALGQPGITFAEVRDLALALPAVEEGTAYGTPAFRVKGRFLLRLREDGETLAVRIPMEERDALLQMDPDVFFLTDHYRAYPSILVRLAQVRCGQLADLLELAWRAQAPKRLVAAFEG